jgi:hypothetical protein
MIEITTKSSTSVNATARRGRDMAELQSEQKGGVSIQYIGAAARAGLISPEKQWVAGPAGLFNNQITKRFYSGISSLIYKVG